MATKKKSPASAVYKVPIDQLMAAVDLRKGDYYTKLSDEDKKSFKVEIEFWNLTDFDEMSPNVPPDV